eukprot:7306896-Prorocentrum_lima.AAC.1
MGETTQHIIAQGSEDALAFPETHMEASAAGDILDNCNKSFYKAALAPALLHLSLIHISEPTRLDVI